jgi:replicative DNA helicase
MKKIKPISFNIQNEQVVIAGMIKTNEFLKKYAKELKPYHFIGSKHRTIFNILKRLVDKNLEFDFDTFETLAREDEEYGGIQYLIKIEKLFDENANIDYHVNILKTDSIKHHIKKRRLEKLIDSLEDPHSELVDINSQLQKIKEDINENFSDGNLLSGENLKVDYIKDYEQRKLETIFIPTGIEGLDKRLAEGMARKKCSIWSARPGMGKTTTMANIALNLIRGVKNSQGDIISEPKKVILVPLETGYISYIDIMVSVLIKERMESEQDSASAIPSKMIGLPLENLIRYSDKITEEEDELVKWAIDEIMNNENLTVTDDPSLSLDKLEVILESGNYDVCIVDLWEKLSDIKIDAGKIAEKLNKTQAIAKAANTHIAIVHQIRRSSEKGKVKKPTMESLKNSGGYEEIADLIVLMHRAKYYNPDLDEDVIEYIIAKQRRGEMNKTVFHDFEGSFGRIGKYRRNYIEAENEEVF